MEHTRENLTRAMRWQIAHALAQDRLQAINEGFAPVVFHETLYTRYIKRALDIFLALTALTVTLPVNLLLGAAAFFDVGRPIFFRQKRLGKNAVPFYLVKFRSMRNTRDERGELLPPHLRVTRWGRFVRKTSLDELLNFWSVLKGDMSIIGPRPLPPEYLERFHLRHRARLLVRPGLECPPREKLDHVRTWQEHLDNDVWYVEHVSFLTDVKLCLCLVGFALDRKTAALRGGGSTGTFMGYSPEGTAINLQQVPQTYIENAFFAAEAEE